LDQNSKKNSRFDDIWLGLAMRSFVSEENGIHPLTDIARI